MDFIPTSVRYTAAIQNRELHVDVLYSESKKEYIFYFESNKIASRAIPNDDLDALNQKDDLIIDLMIREYCKINRGVIADIFAHHADKVRLKSKEIDMIVREGIIELKVHFLVKKNFYNITVSKMDDTGKFSCELRADSFSEVLEEMRLFSSILGTSNVTLGQYIDSFARDEIKNKFDWYEE